MKKFACVQDFEDHAKLVLSPPLFSHIRGVYNDTNDFSQVQLKHRGLANLKYFIDPIKCDLLGATYSSPVGFGPTQM